ncbi:MAG: CPBP family intramembrane metalloprotease [Clostridia bacterium]|nr:CPBP family intramembrane metalloprotease [Clostridia bacterium]
MPNKKRPVANRISLLLLAVLVLLCLLDIFTGFFLKNITNLHKILIYCVIFILPMFIYMKTGKYKTREMIKTGFIKIKHLPFVLLFGISVSVICAVINAASIAVFSGLFDMQISTSTVSFASENPFVIGLTAVFLPALCEEALIRGIAMSEYEKYGLPIAVVLTSLVFALFHGSLVSFVSLLVAGICYAVLTCLFKSIWPAVICHCINNALAVFMNESSDKVGYLMQDSIFVIIFCVLVFAVLYFTLLLAEGVVNDLGDKNRFKTNRKNMVYGEPLGSVYIWIFFAVSIFNMVRNVII